MGLLYWAPDSEAMVTPFVTPMAESFVQPVGWEFDLATLTGKAFQSDSITDFAAVADATAVTSWSDLSGNARPATQATGTKQPTVQTVLGRKEVRYDGGDGLATAAFAINSNKVLVAVVGRVTSGANPVLVEYGVNPSVTVAGLTVYRPSTSGGKPIAYHFGSSASAQASFENSTGWTDSATVHHRVITVHDLSLTSREARMFFDSVGQGIYPQNGNNAGVLGSVALALNLGARDPNGTLTLPLTGGEQFVLLADWSGWSPETLGDNLIGLENYLRDRFFGLAPLTAHLMFDGDSRTQGIGFAGEVTPIGNTYPAQLSALLTTPHLRNSLALAGQTVVQMLADDQEQVDPYRAPLAVPGKNVAVVWGGVNDNVDSAATIYANIKSYCQARKTAGWDKVVVCTETPCKSASCVTNGWDAKRLTINTDIRANAVSEGWADTVADLAADAAFDADADADNVTNYNADKVHLTTTGYGIVAGIVRTALNAIGIT